MTAATFGIQPKGERLANIKASPNYRDGAFQNISATEVMLKGASYFTLLRDFINKPKNNKPAHPLPSVKQKIAPGSFDKLAITWFGHSSYLIQCRGKNILVDPVFSGSASPFSFMVKAFPGTNIYQAEDMPPIDMLIITHDHYDHLDHKTIKKLSGKIQHIYTSLGVGEHLEHWGIPAEKITEFDWWQETTVEEGIKLIAVPARHFSGRSFKRNQTLWSAFVLRIYGYNIFIGGDSGYDIHFKIIGEKYGPFDIAMLETGQYNLLWPLIHMMPEETIEAAKDLEAKWLMPVHWGKFALAYHPWNEPVERATKAAAEKSMPITTPMIGETVILDEVYPIKHWWKEAVVISSK